MSKNTKTAKQNDTKRLPQKKSSLTSKDINKVAERSSRARLIQEVVGTDDIVRRSYERYFSNCPDSPPSHPSENELPYQFVNAFPSKVGLRWNPRVEVSSGDEIPMEPCSERQAKPNCNCANCTSTRCASKRSSTCLKSGFKDNIMTFSDKVTMTPRLNHAGCGTRTPFASPKTSDVSVTASYSQTRLPTSCCTSPIPKQIFKKSCLTPDYYDQYNYDPCYDEAVRDTDVNEEYYIPQKVYNRHCVSQMPGVQYESGKRNLYNEGISDKIADKYPVSPPSCPYKMRYGNRAFCRNQCPDCSCLQPQPPKTSRYHQACKVVGYKGPVYYADPEDLQHFVAIPTILADRHVIPVGRPTRAPSIILPKKVLTSQRDIDSYIKEERAKARRKGKNK